MAPFSGVLTPPKVRGQRAEHEEPRQPADYVASDIADRVLQAERVTEQRQASAVPQDVDIKGYWHDP